jgi:hypothetical protein
VLFAFIVLEQDDEPGLGVPVERERLFEVDVRSMKVGLCSDRNTSVPDLAICDTQLRPIYWKSSGPQIDVMRGVWMYDKVCPRGYDVRKCRN